VRLVPLEPLLGRGRQVQRVHLLAKLVHLHRGVVVVVVVFSLRRAERRRAQRLLELLSNEALLVLFPLDLSD
jgi:adenylylsulfate kinase-like enzyme